MFSSKVGLIYRLLTSSCWIFALSFCNTFLASQHTKARKAPLHVFLAFNLFSQNLALFSTFQQVAQQ